MSDLGPETRDCGGDPAAYVLGALEPEEVKAFRAHLQTCVVCRDEVSTFERTVDALAASVPQYRAPKSLRREVLQGVRAEPRAKPSRRRRPLPNFAGLIPRPALGALAAVIVAVAVLAGLELGSSGGTRTLQASVVGASGRAQVRLANGRAELIVQHFPAPPAGHIYEVWLKRGSASPAPTHTLFSVTRTGAGDVGVAGNLNGVTEMLVTPEPAGGSLTPTHSPVIVARLD